MSEELPSLDSAVIPRATYRVQFHAGMRFDDAICAVPYLAALGISHLYASPYLRAREGSTHGYDIVDHNALNPEIGDAADHGRLCDELARHDMGQVLDIVPNHMGVLEADNAWWLDVLESGRASEHAVAFDIEWEPPSPELRHKLLIPVLGDHYGRVLESGELVLGFDADDGVFSLRYYKHRFLLDPQQLPELLEVGGGVPVEGIEPRDAMEVLSLVEAFGRLPPHDTDDDSARTKRQHDLPLLKRRLVHQYAQHAWLRETVRRAVTALNGVAGDPRSFDALDRVLSRQAWELSSWRAAADDINYRRFFDVNTLAALRMERLEVFEATHRTILRWVREGKVDGLRVDHPDGLADPQQYLERLQRSHVQAQKSDGCEPRALYVAVEKILADHEHLPADWAMHGGTGYRFSNLVHGVLVDSRNEASFDALYREFTGRTQSFDEVLYSAKRLVMHHLLAADLQVLTEALHRIALADRRTRDFTRNRLRTALVEVTAGFPVYRTYITERGTSDADRRHIDWACAAARRSSAGTEHSAIDFLQKVVLDAPVESDAWLRAAKLQFVLRWQQFTAPVMAKAMEDTTFYRHVPLASLNDVGGDPRRFGLSVAAFHALNGGRARHRTHALLATSTHDSKRSEDVRARLAVLSEVPGEWRDAIARWSAMNRARAGRADVQISPNDEYLLYQTLVGIWPLRLVDDEVLASLRERVQTYMLKAVREAKDRTSWIDADPVYEQALAQFIELLLHAREPNPFLTDFESFVGPIMRLGLANSLNQVVFKLTVPGVPDIYQGCETWNWALVDPDNRRPVDFAALAVLLDDVVTRWSRAVEIEGFMRIWWLEGDARLKLCITWRMLQLRREHPALFAHGSYVPIGAAGSATEHVVSYARSLGEQCCIVIGSRWLHRLSRDAGARFAVHADGSERLGGSDGRSWVGSCISLPDALGYPRWVDLLTGRDIMARRLDDQWVIDLDCAYAVLPVAVLRPATTRSP